MTEHPKISELYLWWLVRTVRLRLRLINQRWLLDDARRVRGWVYAASTVIAGALLALPVAFRLDQILPLGLAGAALVALLPFAVELIVQRRG